jgi:hypothetical protein
MKIIVFIQVEKGKKFWTHRGLYRSFDELIKGVHGFLAEKFNWRSKGIESYSQKDKTS